MQEYWRTVLIVIGMMLIIVLAVGGGAGALALGLWLLGTGPGVMKVGMIIGACVGMAMLMAAIEKDVI